MNQPMTAKEIDLWDKVFTELAIRECGIPEHISQVATAVIAARRAALIADAHVGKRLNEHYWECRCNCSPNFGSSGMEQEYCEDCHTRRPDEVEEKQDQDDRRCETCKYGDMTFITAPCASCDDCNKWKPKP